MATITLDTSPVYTIGFMGDCSSSCVDVPIADDILANVQQILQVNSDGTTFAPFAPELAGFGTAFNPYVSLECGYMYFIIWKPITQTQKDAGLSVTIDGLNVINFAGKGNPKIDHGRITADCAPVTASCTCSAVVETGALKVDFDATTLSESPLTGTSVDGRIKGVEIVFENIVFGNKSGLSVSPAIQGFKDTQNADTLNFYYDYSIRSTSVNDEATEANKTKSVIGFIDTTQNGTGKSKTDVGALTFSVASTSFTMTGDTPIISDVRVFDSSAEVAQYNITRCGDG